jgi:protein TonB
VNAFHAAVGASIIVHAAVAGAVVTVWPPPSPDQLPRVVLVDLVIVEAGEPGPSDKAVIDTAAGPDLPETEAPVLEDFRASPPAREAEADPTREDHPRSIVSLPAVPEAKIQADGQATENEEVSEALQPAGLASLEQGVAMAKTQVVARQPDPAEPAAWGRALPRSKPAPRTLADARAAKPEGADGPRSDDAILQPIPSDGSGPVSARTVPGAQVARRGTAQGDTEDHGRDARPAKGNPAPIYPLAARRRGQEGRVLLTVVVDRTGVVAEARVSESSGHRLLDRSALKAVRQWHFLPAQRRGRAVATTVSVPVVFALEAPGDVAQD